MSDTTTTSTKQGSVEMDDVLRYELLESNGPKGAPTGDPVLSVRNLKVSFNTEAGRVDAVRGVNFDLWGGRTLGIVGESGSGKSVTALSLIGLLDDNAHVTGSIKLGNEELIGKTDEEMSELRGTKISMIFQDPLSALTPMFSIGDQLAEALLTHNPHMSRADVRKRCIELLSIVGITDPENRLDSFPHEFSGGMRQRVMIAMALACQPSLLICDEPTTALDVTVQAQILQIIDRMKQDLGTAVMLITHDMGVVSEMADWVLVMYAGHRVEYAQSAELFTNPLHPYAQGLIASIPSFDERTKELYAIPGSVPMLSHMPSGCPFHPRCPFAKDICKKRRPSLTAVGEDNCHTVSCWKYTDEWGE